MSVRLLVISFAVCAAAALGGCAANAGATLTPADANAARAASIVRAAERRPAASSPIQHVVYIIQENRSFNNLFMGFKGATTQNYGYNTNGKKIMLRSQSIATGWDIDHSIYGYWAAYDNGKLDGWNNEYACCGQPPNFAYAYAPKKEVKPYWLMAEQYVLGDQVFQSNLDGSYIAHQYAIAAYANSEVDFPSSAWGCQGGPYDVIPTLNQYDQFGPNVPVCEDYTTLGDELDAAGISWKFYTHAYNTSGGLWSAYSAINHIYNGPDWTNNVITPASQFLTDVSSGNLPAVSWITPTFENSDHAGFEAIGGPAWVASLVNAVGQSKRYWNSTAIFVIWDDWGGWFDPVAPVYKDYDGLGFRIPLIAISAYAKTGYVSHVQYESSSVLRFMEDNFGVAPLAASDSRAADPASDFFDYSAAPRKFKTIAAEKVRGPAWDGRAPLDGD